MAVYISNPKERQQPNSIPTEIYDAELGRFFTHDLESLNTLVLRLKHTHRLDQTVHIWNIHSLG